MRRIVVGLVTLASALILSACGGGSGSVPSQSGGVAPIQAAKMQSLVFDQNNTAFTTSVALAKNLNDNYEITVEPTMIMIDGCEVRDAMYNPASLYFGKDHGIGYKQTLQISGKFNAPCSATSYKIDVRTQVKGGGATRTETLTFSNTQSGEDDSGDSPVSPSGYQLTNVRDITVTMPKEEKEIAVQLVKDGIPQAGKTVVAKSIPEAFGNIAKASVTTGEDGYARFTYVAPDTLTAGTQSVELVFTDENSSEITTSVTITVVQPTQSYAFTVNNQEIEINRENETKTISAIVVNQDGVGVPNLSVSITAVKGNKYGAIISDAIVQTDASGRAVFTYQGPDDIATIDGNTTKITLFLSQYKTIKQDIVLNFKKVDDNKSVPIVVISNNYKEINLTQNNQNVPIEVQVFDQVTKAPYTKGNVKVLLPQKVLNGVDVGSFATYTASIGPNGKASFSYTGP